MKIYSYEKDNVIICNNCGKWIKEIPCCRCGNYKVKARRVHV